MQLACVVKRRDWQKHKIIISIERTGKKKKHVHNCIKTIEIVILSL